MASRSISLFLNKFSKYVLEESLNFIVEIRWEYNSPDVNMSTVKVLEPLK